MDALSSLQKLSWILKVLGEDTEIHRGHLFSHGDFTGSPGWDEGSLVPQFHKLGLTLFSFEAAYQNMSFIPSCYLLAQRTKINKSKWAFQATPTGESQPMAVGIEHLWTPPDNFCPFHWRLGD